VFENRVLRKIFGPRKDGVTGEWRKLHNEEHCSVSKIEKNEMDWVCSAYEGEERCIQSFGGET
jgi:hypothetical protein